MGSSFTSSTAGVAVARCHIRRQLWFACFGSGLERGHFSCVLCVTFMLRYQRNPLSPVDKTHEHCALCKILHYCLQFSQFLSHSSSWRVCSTGKLIPTLPLPSETHFDTLLDFSVSSWDLLTSYRLSSLSSLDRQAILVKEVSILYINDKKKQRALYIFFKGEGDSGRAASYPTPSMRHRIVI